MAAQQYDYGMIGLGTMGRNLVYNISDHGYTVAGFDKDAKQVDLFNKEGKGKQVLGTGNLQEFVNSLKSPRVIILLVPAGKIVDAVIEELVPLVSKEDLLLDCGNSHFTDTDRREARLAKESIHFMGIGVSGGEEGARYGPSIMPGGPQQVYARIAPMLQAISAKVDKDPCVAYLGTGSSGHYVKMVHNGIEYALMQLIAESYHLLKEAGGLTNDELHKVFTDWNNGRLRSFLIEITAAIFAKDDELTGKRLVDVILDTAHQKGTGKWTSQSALDIGLPVPAIDTAVAARLLSAHKKERILAEPKLQGPSQKVAVDKAALIADVEQSLYFSMLVSYAQGMALLQQASKELNYGLKLNVVAAIWRGGCIIRAGLLENIRSAYAKQPDMPNLLTDEFFAKELATAQTGIRSAVQAGVANGIPVLAMMSVLGYYDSYRRAWLPTNLVQAQRDYFGAHTYERIDREGVFHTQWHEKK